jgi:hypothetical protein
MAVRVTWENEIKGYFNQMDVGCMRARGLDLSDYATVKARAKLILTRLKLRVTDPNSKLGMPQGDRAWPQEKIDKFEAWINDCSPQTETDAGPPCP